MSSVLDWNPAANDLFLQAAELGAPDERRVFLDQHCAGRPDLRQQVESLLAASEHLGEFLKRPAAVAGEAVKATEDYRPLPEGPGAVIGPYKLLQVIGEGGMGVVYMAEQIEPVERRVALKIIKAGMDTRQVIARFEAERQALALMDHPNIAKVLDAGTTSGNLPYFVMELVKGVPITQYCDEKHLTLRERLALFMPVCQAIQHAHQKGIIHRDIKPTNVLIAQYDGQPVPKVIDFGVAKATIQKLTEKTMFTQFGQLVGTLEYMSPEQAQLNQLDIDTRSDVYALGVLLYELLTGETPFDKKRLHSAALDEVLRIIREEEPPRPSTKLSSAATLPTIAANRGTDSAKLGRAVRGELDWIVMKALDKDRARRYESASGFANDVAHYLADEPVQACPPSASYRLVKFVRRNKVAIATTALVFAVSFIGGSVSIWNAFEADKARALAKQEAELSTILSGETNKNAEIIDALAKRSRKFDEAASKSLNRLVTKVGHHPRLSDAEFQPLRRDLLESVLYFWDQAIGIDDTTSEGTPRKFADFYRRQRALCLARSGEHEQAATEADDLWQRTKVPTGEHAYDLARVYGLCAAAANDDGRLATRYAQRAWELLGKAAATGYFQQPAHAERLSNDPDLAPLRARHDFAELLRPVKGKPK